MCSQPNSIIETFIHYSKILLPVIQLEQKHSSSKSSNSLIFIHASNGRIITEDQYKLLTKKEEKNTNKRQYQSCSSSSNPLVIKRPQLQTNKNEGNKNVSNLSIEKLNEEIAKFQSEIEKIQKETVTEKEIEKYFTLSSKWKKIAQEAVYSLLELFPRDENYQNNTIGSVIKTFKIDSSLIDYDEDNDCFNE